MFIYQKNAMFRINLITRLLVARKGKDVDFLAIIIQKDTENEIKNH